MHVLSEAMKIKTVESNCFVIILPYQVKSNCFVIILPYQVKSNCFVIILPYQRTVTFLIEIILLVFISTV